MTVPTRVLMATLALSIGLVSASVAQGAAIKIKETKPGLMKQAKITPEAAQATAQAKYPTGTLKEGELEKEKGKLIYSIDVQLPNVKGIEEVNIDAMTGAVISTAHENPEDEAKEKAAEKAKAKPKPKVKKPPTP